FDPPSNGPSVGIGVRWPGHRNERNEQPNAGFLPLGALGWYRFEPDGRNLLQILGNHLGQSNRSRQLELGQTYIFKMRVESSACDGAIYRLKVWPATGSEPAAW